MPRALRPVRHHNPCRLMCTHVGNPENCTANSQDTKIRTLDTAHIQLHWAQTCTAMQGHECNLLSPQPVMVKRASSSGPSTLPRSKHNQPLGWSLSHDNNRRRSMLVVCGTTPCTGRMIQMQCLGSHTPTCESVVMHTTIQKRDSLAPIMSQWNKGTATNCATQEMGKKWVSTDLSTSYGEVGYTMLCCWCPIILLCHQDLQHTSVMSCTEPCHHARPARATHTALQSCYHCCLKPTGMAAGSAGMLLGPACVAITVTDNGPEGAGAVRMRYAMCTSGPHSSAASPVMSASCGSTTLAGRHAHTT